MNKRLLFFFLFLLCVYSVNANNPEYKINVVQSNFLWYTQYYSDIDDDVSFGNLSNIVHNSYTNASGNVSGIGYYSPVGSFGLNTTLSVAGYFWLNKTVFVTDAKIVYSTYYNSRVPSRIVVDCSTDNMTWERLLDRNTSENAPIADGYYSCTWGYGSRLMNVSYNISMVACKYFNISLTGNNGCHYAQLTALRIGGYETNLSLFYALHDLPIIDSISRRASHSYLNTGYINATSDANNLSLYYAYDCEYNNEEMEYNDYQLLYKKHQYYEDFLSSEKLLNNFPNLFCVNCSKNTWGLCNISQATYSDIILSILINPIRTYADLWQTQGSFQCKTNNNFIDSCITSKRKIDGLYYAIPLSCPFTRYIGIITPSIISFKWQQEYNSTIYVSFNDFDDLRFNISIYKFPDYDIYHFYVNGINMSEFGENNFSTVSTNNELRINIIPRASNFIRIDYGYGDVIQVNSSYYNISVNNLAGESIYLGEGYFDKNVDRIIFRAETNNNIGYWYDFTAQSLFTPSWSLSNQYSCTYNSTGTKIMLVYATDEYFKNKDEYNTKIFSIDILTSTDIIDSTYGEFGGSVPEEKFRYIMTLIIIGCIVLVSGFIYWKLNSFVALDISYAFIILFIIAYMSAFYHVAPTWIGICSAILLAIMITNIIGNKLVAGGTDASTIFNTAIYLCSVYTLMLMAQIGNPTFLAKAGFSKFVYVLTFQMYGLPLNISAFITFLHALLVAIVTAIVIKNSLETVMP